MVKDFRSNGLFKELSAEQLDMLESHLHLREYSDGDMIMEEGDDGDFLCLIESGEVEVLRNQMAIATMGPDEHFGLMSYLDGSKRAASVRSKGETRVRVMAFKTLSDLSTSKEHGAVFKQILANHIDQQHQLLRSMNDTVVSEMQAKLKEAELRVNFGKLFMMVVFGLTGYIFILDFMSWLEMQSGIVFSTLLIIALGSIGYRFIKHSTLPDETFGLTLKNWKPAVIDALVWTFALMAFAVVVKWIIISAVPQFRGTPLLTIDLFFAFGWVQAGLIIVAYILFVPAQEIIVRCALQGSLQHLLQGKHATWKAIVLTSLLFSAFHLIVNPVFAYATFVPSLFWGWLFARNPSLLGVSVSHIILGVFVIWFEYLPIPGLVQI